MYQLQAVFQSPLSLDEHEVLPIEADEQGCAVFDDAFAFGKLVEGDGLRHATERQREDGKREHDYFGLF
jgi:hypothetical protein